MKIKKLSVIAAVALVVLLFIGGGAATGLKIEAGTAEYYIDDNTQVEDIRQVSTATGYMVTAIPAPAKNVAEEAADATFKTETVKLTKVAYAASVTEAGNADAVTAKSRVAPSQASGYYVYTATDKVSNKLSSATENAKQKKYASAASGFRSCTKTTEILNDKTTKEEGKDLFKQAEGKTPSAYSGMIIVYA